MATTHGFTPEELASLTDDELEALNDESTPGINEDVDPAAEPEQSAEEKAAASDDDVVTIEGTATEIKPEPEAGAETLPAVIEEAAKPTLTVPQYELPEDYDARVAEIQKQQDDLAQRFDDGEMSAREYKAAERELNLVERELHDMKLKAEIANDSQEAVVEDTKDTWYNKTVPEWMTAHAATYKQGSIAYKALHEEVARIQTARFDAGQDYVSKSVLDEAHRNVQNEIRAAAGLPPLGETPAAEQPKPKPAEEKRRLPPQLADVPAADGAFFEEGGEFAAISRLEGVDYENALAAMPDHKREAYLNSSL
jgi:hypothetical protein